ncbi:UNKNOWN [Stylonychia lemnae]|uniref:GAT domain-containing protein n=1 Tax=Stylonychia lemnae TaxID=5949 RepID=A0A077ZY67_STYLE|nr:UNKNOWN [Stylonychia lemnae]|eukprot:CDW74172.1 UNKNOWN [Stylonychia lemnae]
MDSMMKVKPLQVNQEQSFRMYSKKQQKILKLVLPQRKSHKLGLITICKRELVILHQIKILLIEKLVKILSLIKKQQASPYQQNGQSPIINQKDDLFQSYLASNIMHSKGNSTFISISSNHYQSPNRTFFSQKGPSTSHKKYDLASINAASRSMKPGTNHVNLKTNLLMNEDSNNGKDSGKSNAIINRAALNKTEQGQKVAFLSQPSNAIGKVNIRSNFINSYDIRRHNINRSQSPVLIDNSIHAQQMPHLDSNKSAIKIGNLSFNESSLAKYRYQAKNSAERDTAVRFMKAREQAEQEAKRHLEKLNDLMKKRQVKEKKMEEILRENSQERLMRLDQMSRKRIIAKDRVEKDKKDQEQKSMKFFNSTLKQIEDRLMRQKSVEKERAQNDFLKQENSRMSAMRHQTSYIGYTARTNQNDDELNEQLRSLDDKLNKGVQRSQMLKQQISTRAAQVHQKIIDKNLKQVQEQHFNEKWSSYLMKRNKVEQKLGEQRKYMDEKWQYQHQQNQVKQEKSVQIKKDQEKSFEQKFKQYQRKFLSSEKQIKQNQEKLRLEKLKKEEIWHLKRQDQLDNLEEQKMLREQERIKLQTKHHWMNFQSQSIKEMNRQNDEARLKQEMERRNYIMSKKKARPYDEMKDIVLADAAITPDIKKFHIKTVHANMQSNI